MKDKNMKKEDPSDTDYDSEEYESEKEEDSERETDRTQKRYNLRKRKRREDAPSREDVSSETEDGEIKTNKHTSARAPPPGFPPGLPPGFPFILQTLLRGNPPDIPIMIQSVRQEEEDNEDSEDTRKYTKEEMDYMNSLSRKRRKEIDMKEKKIMNSNCKSVNIPHRFNILDIPDISDNTKRFMLSRLSSYNISKSSGSENHKLEQWLEYCVNKIPHGKRTVEFVKSEEDIRRKIEYAEQMLNSEIYGMNNAKGQILRLLARILGNGSSNKSKIPVIGLEGPPGSGKTSMAKVLGKALGTETACIPMGGVNDASYLTGFSLTYEGSVPGKITDALVNSQTLTPVIVLDEIDKLGDKKNEVEGVIVHLLDRGSGESMFHDKYCGFPIDLSGALIVCTFNNRSTIDPIILDRMITIQVSGYTKTEKATISEKYKFADILKHHGMTQDMVEVKDTFFSEIVRYSSTSPFNTTKDGMRETLRVLENVISHVNLERIRSKKENTEKKKVILDGKLVRRVQPPIETNIILAGLYI
jgi:ATP-dependent Lon protease